jgi:hypothetical protein
MAIYSPRTRLVNFRLSEDEYQTLKDAAIRQGARSISDFARGAILTSVSSTRGDGGQMDLSGLERKVSDIQNTVERISGLLGNPPHQPASTHNE